MLGATGTTHKPTHDRVDDPAIVPGILHGRQATMIRVTMVATNGVATLIGGSPTSTIRHVSARASTKQVAPSFESHATAEAYMHRMVW